MKKKIILLITAVMLIAMLVPTSVFAYTQKDSKNLKFVKSNDVFYAKFPAATLKDGKVMFKDYDGAGAYYTATVKVYNVKDGKLKKTLKVDTSKYNSDDVFSKTTVTKQTYKFVVTNVKGHNIDSSFPTQGLCVKSLKPTLSKSK